MTGLALLGLGLAAVVLLLVMVIWLRVPAFVALLVVALATAVLSGIPLSESVGVVTGGIGNTLGSVTVVVGLGAMLGRIIEASGGADALARYFTGKLSARHVVAAIVAAAFILGIPVFFDVGFIILAPIVFGFARTAGINPLKIGLPVAGTLLTVHVTLPPHPGPVAAAEIVGAEIGTMLASGLPLAAITVVIGYFAAKLFNVDRMVLGDSPATETPEAVTNPPSAWTVIGVILLPIVQILVGTAGSLVTVEGSTAHEIIAFVGAAPVALLTAVIIAWIVIGRQQGWSLSRGSSLIDSALPAVAIVIFVTGAGGAFAGVLVKSGIGQVLSDLLVDTNMPLILTAYLMALALRASQGSATVSMLTTAGLLATPIVDAGIDGVHAALIALVIGFGSLGLSHVNDSGFWIVTRYQGLTVKQGLQTWTLLSTVFSLVGFILSWGVYAVI
ncbi:GntP family transporter [Corynebacterium pacaense]|uniref:GntP family transporter n=1 Tax=Corynebacterium pacaense TaxID=1816684 RepID=UPI0009BC3841|nr:GntP family transporter [Corynebacterium pacaense]